MRDAPWSRRHAVAALLSLPILPLRAAEGDYPNRPVRLIVPSAAGSASDWIARLVCAEVARDIQQAILIDNRPGASSIIGTEAVGHAASDGYTLGYAMPAFALNRAVGMTLPYDTERRFRPIIQIGWQPELLVINTALGVSTLADLLAVARQRPGRLTYASSGSGGIFHLSAELMRAQAAVHLVHVPFSSSPPAVTAVIGGHVDMMFNALSAVLSPVQDKRLLAVGVTSDKRSPVLPDVPTMAEAGVNGCEVLTWGGIYAPAAVPETICTFINERFNAALAAPRVRDGLLARGYEAIGGSAAQFDTFIRSEVDKWTRVARFAGLRT